jgi:hypothetical protein
MPLPDWQPKSLPFFWASAPKHAEPVRTTLLLHDCTMTSRSCKEMQGDVRFLFLPSGSEASDDLL